jgi:phage gp29-like protein
MPHSSPSLRTGRPGRVFAAAARNLLAFPKMPAFSRKKGKAGLPTNNAQPDRQVLDDPRDAWQLWFPRNLTVQQVVNILRASRMGDQWQLASLVEVMLDSWPVLKKCQHELRSAVSQTKFSVHAYTEGGKEPTRRAQEKADLVLRAMDSFRPNPAITDERGFPGMVYDLTNAYLLGMSLVELQWHNQNGVIVPRCSTFVHPAHITLDDNAAVMLNNAKNGETISFDPNYFLSSFYQSQSGSIYAMGMVRSIGWWWAALLAVQQWMFGSAQKHGSPYTFLTYARSLMGNKAELDKIEEALNNSGANRYLMAPEGCTADLKPPGTMGTENPQRYMKEQADKECMMLFLGQTSSTNAEPGRLGNNDQHMEVRAERKEHVAKWIGTVLTEQWATAILRRNYGDDTECPKVEPDFTEVETRMQAAQRVAVEINTGLPFVAEEIYNDLNRKVPQAGDQTIQRGQLGVMSDPAGTPIQPTLEEQVEQQAMIAEASGQFEEPVQARGVVRSAGTSEGAKKGWENRPHSEQSQEISNKFGAHWVEHEGGKVAIVGPEHHKALVRHVTQRGFRVAKTMGPRGDGAMQVHFSKVSDGSTHQPTGEGHVDHPIQSTEQGGIDAVVLAASKKKKGGPWITLRS